MLKESKYNLVIEKDVDNRILLYNTVTGAVCWFKEDIYNTFHNMNAIQEDDILPEIVRLGYVVPTEFDETSNLEFYKQCYIFNSSPEYLYYVLAPTLSCNYQCEYCFEKDKNLNVTMTNQIWNKTFEFIVKQYNQYKNIKGIRITWFGGEPCLVSEKIVEFSKKIIAFAKENKIEYDAFLVTNGSLLSSSLINVFYSQCAINEAQITLDGLKDIYIKKKKCANVDFDKVINHIVEASDILKLHVRINIDKENKEDIKGILKLLFDEKKLCGKIKVYFAPVKGYSNKDNTSMLPQEYEMFRKTMVEYLMENNWEKSFKFELPSKIATSCGAMRNFTCVIGPGGELYRCEHCLGMPEWIIGTVSDGFFHNSADMKFLGCKTPEKCLKCKIWPVCAGGCLGDKILNGFDFDCDAYEQRIKMHVKWALQKKVSISKNSNEYPY